MTAALPPQVRVYGVSPWIRYLFWGLFGSLALGIQSFAFIDHSLKTACVVVPIGGLLLFATHWYLERGRLELSPAGIRARNPGQTVETSWANVAGVRLGGLQPGLITRDPMEGKGAYRMAAYSGFAMNGMPMYDPETRAYMEARRFIPLKAFAWHLRHGDLVSEVERFAPQVRLQEALVAAREPKPAGAVGKASTRENLLVGLCMALFVGGVIWVVIFAPMPGRHLYEIGMSLFFLISAVSTLLSALNMFRKRAIFMGILFALFSAMLFLSMVVALVAVLH